MIIYEPKLHFKGSLKARRETNRIIVHHSASGNVPAATIHNWHLNQGWAGIGYHYVIQADGTIERGRPENTIGAHAGPAVNPDSIGVVLSGDFSRGYVPIRQLDSLVALVKDIRSRRGQLGVQRHGDVAATACPGSNFPWDKLMKRLGGNKVIYKTLDDVPEWGRAVIETLVKRGSLKGDGDGVLNISEDLLRTLVILNREGVI